MAQINWSKMKSELSKYADLEKLKGEVNRLGQELRKFDIHAHLSPTAKQRLKTVEDRYHEISKSLAKAQRQVDREVSRVLRQIKTQRAKAEKSLTQVKTMAKAQRKKLEKASTHIASRVMSATTKKKTVKKRTTRKKTTASQAN